MIGWTMLGRALRLLCEVLSPGFFRLTNREAYRLIKLKVPELAEGLERRRFQIIFDRKYLELGGEARRLVDAAGIRKIEDMLCREAGLEEWKIGLTVDQPVLGEKPSYWRVYLVSYVGHEKPRSLLEDVLSESVPFDSGVPE
jgi:hypothetical protein